MALSSGIVWTVNGSGNDTYGGGFYPVGGGTDYTYPTSTVFVYTDLVITPANNRLTSVNRPFISADVGNIINITGGTGFTTGRYQISSVSAGIATVDRSCGALNSLGGQAKLGGALLSPGAAAGSMSGGDTIWIGSLDANSNVPHSFIFTNTSNNASNGVITLPAGITDKSTRIIGYNNTRGDLDGLTTPQYVTLAASGIGSATLITCGTNSYISNLKFDGSSLTSIRAISVGSTASFVNNCNFVNLTNGAIHATDSSSVFVACVASGNSSQPSFTGGNYHNCSAKDNTSVGFVLNTAGATAWNCMSSKNLGATTDNFQITATGVNLVNCTGQNPGRDNFRFTAVNGNQIARNCVSKSAVGSGYHATAAADGVWLLTCASHNDGTPTTNITSGNRVGFTTCTGNCTSPGYGSTLRA
jgi:hypothetical protein